MPGLFALLLPLCAVAFEGWEHETISTMSLIVASNHIALAHGKDGQTGHRWGVFHDATGEFIGGLKRGAKPTEVNYGAIVRLVDYMRDPYTMVHASGTGSGWPTNAASCNLPYLEALSRDTFSMYGASHVDYDHFQGRALFSFWFWHKQAVTAAQEDNLWGALMIEAYGNHFLEDFFAPGHLLAPRDDNSHDIYTLMLHDYYNGRGLTYRLLAPDQLASLTHNSQLLVKHTPLEVKVRGGGRSAKGVTLTAEALNTFAHSLSNQTAEFKCYGDNRIKQNPEQLPLVVSYCARAISDVIESYLEGKAVNSFETYQWDAKFFPMRNKPRVEAMDFEVPFGRLTAVDHPRTLATNDFLFRRTIPSADVAKAEERLTFPITEEIGPDALRNRAFGVSAGIQSIALWDDNDSGAHIRGLWELGTVVWGRRFDQIQEDWQLPHGLPKQVALAMGYSGVADSREQGHGPFARVMVPWPQVNLEVSVTVGGRYYFGSGLASGWGDYESIRLEWGMHLASLFFGAGHDRYPTTKDLGHGLMVEAGLTFAFPLSRWKQTLSFAN